MDNRGDVVARLVYLDLEAENLALLRQITMQSVGTELHVRDEADGFAVGAGQGFLDEAGDIREGAFRNNFAARVRGSGPERFGPRVVGVDVPSGRYYSVPQAVVITCPTVGGFPGIVRPSPPSSAIKPS